MSRLRRLAAAWLGLLLMLAIQAMISRALGWGSAALAIGPLMASVVAIVFMEVGRGPGVIRIFAWAGLFWLVILIGLGLMDPLTRRDLPLGTLFSAGPQLPSRVSEGVQGTEAMIESDSARWRVLALVCGGVVLSMTTWFSATAITPELIRVGRLTAAQASWLTNMVQIGFVTGALASSFVSLPDLVSLRKLMGASALGAAVANVALLVVPTIGLLFLARFATGVALAGVYPPALKLVATWFQRGRGTTLGAVIGALTLGSASPHLVRALTDEVAWRPVVAIASVMTLGGGALLWRFAVEGPFPFSRAVFNPRYLSEVFRNRPLLLANCGYFGHMWELYAMWGWFLAYASAALPGIGVPEPKAASLVTFGVVASGAFGAAAGGVLADRIGRTAAAGLMMAVSASCALLIGFTFAGPFWLFLLVATVWGVSVIGDSAQFSAMATELSDPRYVGTALALQLGLGFALTVVTIRLTPLLAAEIGWRWSFLLLVPGPVLGVGAMLLLRRRPEARRIAHGLR